MRHPTAPNTEIPDTCGGTFRLNNRLEPRKREEINSPADQAIHGGLQTRHIVPHGQLARLQAIDHVGQGTRR